MVLEFTKQDTVTYTITVTNGATPVNLTGCTLTFMAKVNRGDADLAAVISETWSSHTTPASGITTLTLDSTQTNVAAGVYYAELQLEDASNAIFTVATGSLTVNEDIVKAT